MKKGIKLYQNKLIGQIWFYCYTCGIFELSMIVALRNGKRKVYLGMLVATISLCWQQRIYLLSLTSDSSLSGYMQYSGYYHRSYYGKRSIVSIVLIPFNYNSVVSTRAVPDSSRCVYSQPELLKKLLPRFESSRQFSYKFHLN